jgi:hypothetical protein
MLYRRSPNGERPCRGYLTVVWVASDQPSSKRLHSWAQPHPLKVRKPSFSSSSLLTTTQEDDDSDEYDNQEDESPELQTAMATKTLLDLEF